MDATLYRSLLAIDPNTNIPISTNYILSTDGVGDLSWQNVIYNISSQDKYLGYLPSTIYTMSNFIYNISTGVLPGSISTINLVSTVEGLGNIGYISSLTFNSTINGLGTLGYISSLYMASTIDGLGTYGYLSSSRLTSTVDGLGSLGYVSTSRLNSTINSLGSQGYISSLSLTSTIEGLATFGYPSVATILYEFQRLGTNPFNYVSSASLYSSIQTVVDGFVSSSTNLYNNKQNIYLNYTGSLVIAGSNINVTISTISSFYFYNTFNNSSITYKGQNGAKLANNPTNSDLYISTLNTQLDTFSTYITKNTTISLEVYPNILFPQINTSSNPVLIHVSSYLTYQASTINLNHQTKFLAANNSGSNLYNTPLRFNIPGNIINNGNVSQYRGSYVLTHRFVDAYSAGLRTGFSTSNVNLYFDSTSSYYLSIQNIAP